MFVRPRRGLVKAAVLATATIGLAASAHAQLQNAPVDLEIFRPAMDSKGFITDQLVGGAGAVGLVVRPRHLVRAPPVAAAGQPDVWYARAAQQLRRRHAGPPVAAGRRRLHQAAAPGRRARRHRPDGRRLRAQPAHRYGHESHQLDDREWTFANQGLGDIQIHPKFRFLNATRRGPRLRGHAVGHPRHRRQELVPRRGEDDLPADGGPGHRARLPGRFRAAINAGMRIRGSPSRFVNNTTSFRPPPPVFWRTSTSPPPVHRGEERGHRRLGLSYGIVPQKFDIVAELYGNYGLDSYSIDATGAAHER